MVKFCDDGWDWVSLDESDILRAIDWLYDKKQITHEKRVEFENFLKMHSVIFAKKVNSNSFALEAARLAVMDVPRTCAVIVADWSRQNFGQVPFPKWGEVVVE